MVEGQRQLASYLCRALERAGPIVYVTFALVSMSDASIFHLFEMYRTLYYTELDGHHQFTISWREKIYSPHVEMINATTTCKAAGFP